jgi:hypothetical protein
MAEPVPTQTPRLGRARKLVAISMIAPFAVYLTVIPTYAIRVPSNPYGPRSGLIALIGIAVAFGIVGVWVYRGIRNIPTAWQSGGCFYGGLIAFYFLPGPFELKDDLRIELAAAPYAVVVVAIIIGIVLLGWLPGRRAGRLVLDNLLSPEVVDSTLTIKFTARGKDIAHLRIMADKLTVEVRPNSGDATTKGAYPLTEVAAVAVRTQTIDGELPVPGAEGRKPIKVTRGEVVVIELSDGQLVFPPRGDAQQVKQFVEARVRRQATVD